MNTPVAPDPPSSSRRSELWRRAAAQPTTYAIMGVAILGLDLCTGPYLQFPILFVLPVTLSAWFCKPRTAYVLSILLPIGRWLIAEFVDNPSPLPYIIANAGIRAVVLTFIAFLVSRTARQNRESKQHADTLVRMCAWSRTIEYEGEWVSFEEYLRRRFGIDTSHGISPAEARKLRRPPEKNDPAP